MLLCGSRLTIAQFADSVARHLLLCGSRLTILQFVDSVAHYLLLHGGRLTIAQFADSVAHHLLLCGGRLTMLFHGSRLTIAQFAGSSSAIREQLLEIRRVPELYFFFIHHNLRSRCPYTPRLFLISWHWLMIHFLVFPLAHGPFRHTVHLNAAFLHGVAVDKVS